MAEKKKSCAAPSKINLLSKPEISVKEHMDRALSKISEPSHCKKKQILIEESSWTQAVPYKHWHSSTKPTDRIGSIFMPSGCNCRLKTLTKRHVVKSRRSPFGADGGILIYPPHIYIEQYNEEIKRKDDVEKEHRTKRENVVNLKDLVDGAWLRKKKSWKALNRKELSVQGRKGKITKKFYNWEVMSNVIQIYNLIL